MMMRIFCFLTLLFVATQPLIGDGGFDGLADGAEAILLINAKTGAVLYEKNSHVPQYPASTTKIATAVYVLKLYGEHLDEKIVARREAIASISSQAKKQSKYRSPPHWLESDGSHIGIMLNEEFAIRDLLMAMMVSSANDAANVLAEHIGGTIPEFMKNLNTYLKEIGCVDTSFNNPHGLHHPEHITTAFDLATLAREAMKDPVFREIVSTVRYTCKETNLEFERTFLQTNLLLRRGAYFYPKARGIKTGTTQAAGKNLVAIATENDRSLIAVALGYRGGRDELYKDVIQLFETAFHQPKIIRHLLPKGEQSLTKKIVGGKGKLKTYLPDGLHYTFYPDEETPIRVLLRWSLSSLPIQKGEQVAVINIFDNEGTCRQTVPLFAAETLPYAPWYRLFLFCTKTPLGKSILFGLALLFIVFALWKLRKGSKRV